LNRTKEFRKRLLGPPILADGAMGTELYARGVYVNRCFDELNLSQTDLIARIHFDYLRAGSEIIETNTYGANRFKLKPHGLDGKVERINELGAMIARHSVEKAGSRAFVAGSIGPLGQRLAPLGKISIGNAREAFKEQVIGLIKGGVDLIMIETMVDPAELTLAVEAVREVSDIPLVAQFTLKDWNETVYGATIDRVVFDSASLDIDVIGINCSIGPNKLLQAAKHLIGMTDRPVCIQPNAGELEWIENRLMSKTTPEYFAEYAKRMALSGVKIIGGCCGTKPAHIKAIDAALRAVAPDLSKVRIAVRVQEIEKPEKSKEPLPYRELSDMAATIEDGRFFFSVEINPPRSPIIKQLVSKVNELKENGVNLINVPDGPRASARLSAMALAHLLRIETGIQPILHYTCRDRNILGMQSDLLGAEALGIDNILCVTGDPPKLGDYPMATAVFDVDAIGLLRIADNLNHSLDLAGNPIPHGTAFHLGCGVNPGSIDQELEIERLHRKIENGARFVMTQPVFDDELFFNFLDRVGLRKVPYIVGILPLASYRNAEFFHNEVPGMQIPDEIRERLRGVDDPDEAARIGVEIAVEALIKTAPRAVGAYIMPPFGRIDLALEVIKGFRRKC
jgi:homocysteine S-methyltransferase